MKQIIIVVLGVITAFNSIGQETPKEDSTKNKFHGGRTGLFTSFGSDFNTGVFVDYTFQKNESTYSIGGIFSERLQMVDNHTFLGGFDPFNLNGIHASYAFYPNTIKKPFNLFFEVDAMFIHRSVKWNGDDPAITNQLTKAYRSYFQNTLSYGLRINLFKHAYIFNSIGLGYGFTFSGYEYEDRPMRRYSFPFFTGIAKLGIGLKL